MDHRQIGVAISYALDESTLEYAVSFSSGSYVSSPHDCDLSKDLLTFSRISLPSSTRQLKKSPLANPNRKPYSLSSRIVRLLCPIITGILSYAFSI